MTTPPAKPPDLNGLVADIVSAYVAKHAVEAAALAELIRSVQRALGGLSAGVPETPPEEKPQPAVPIKKSVFPDYIVCLEDGRRLKMLKRYLKTTYGMEPKEYRAKWGLPASYPMVAPNYAEHRSGLAKAHGLGRRPQSEGEIAAEPEPVVQEVPEGRHGGPRPKAAE